MSLLNNIRLLVKFVSVLVFCLPATVLGQGSLRIIDKTTWRSEPIRIQKLRSGGKVIELGKRFYAEGEWLHGLTVIVENVSNKAIARIELNLAFPRAKGSSPEIPTYIVRMIYGLDPADPSYIDTQKPVLPGESAQLLLPDANLPIIKTDLETLGYPENTSHAQIRVDSVTFLDGSTWAGDEILFPDPKNPMRKINPRLQRQIPALGNSKPYNAPSGYPSGERFHKAKFTFDSSTGFYSDRFSLRSLVTFQTLPDETLPCNTLFITTNKPLHVARREAAVHSSRTSLRAA